MSEVPLQSVNLTEAEVLYPWAPKTGFGFKVRSLGFKVRSLGLKVPSLGFKVPSLGFKVPSVGFEGSECRI